MKLLRTLLVLLLSLAPILFWLLVWRPAESRMAANRVRVTEAEGRIQELPRYTPLSAEEATFLEDPSAPWRQRIPLVLGDRDRLAHYHRVVTSLDQAFGRAGIRIHGMRSSWDPIRASFTLDKELAWGPSTMSPLDTPQDGTLRAWVLEVQLDGPTEGLFTGLDRLRAIPPLLEPVGFRWEATPERRAQALWLRNLILVPADGPR